MDIIEHLQNHLKTAGQVYPDAWRQVDEFRQSRGVDLPKWPGWCYLPMAAWYAIVSEGNEMPLHMISDVSSLAAMGSWRVTQGVYQFDTDLSEALNTTTLIGEMPTDVLLRLPEYCLYIQGNNLTWLGDEITGFWVHLEWDANTERRELRLLLDTEQMLIPQILHLGPWTVTGAVDRACAEAAKQAQLNNLPGIDNAELVQRVAADLQPLLARILYICSDEPDIIDRKQPDYMPQRPKPKRTKKGWRIFPPNKIRVWTVGDALGEQLRSYANSEEAQQRSGPKPHIRRAHWHGYWTGPRDGGQKFIYKWLPPVVVAGE